MIMWILLVARAARFVDRTDNIFGDRFTAALVQRFATRSSTRSGAR